jgi:CheY-like chemotaxis protein
MHADKERILVVEDEPSMRIALQDALEAAGYRVLIATDGRTGLERALKEKPALLLLLALPLVLIARRRRGRTPPAVRGYESTVRRARLRRLPCETPRELLARARSQGLAAERLESLAAATRRHERERYAA